MNYFGPFLLLTIFDLSLLKNLCQSRTKIGSRGWREKWSPPNPSPPPPHLQTIAVRYCLGTSFCSIMFCALSRFNTNFAKDRLPCTFSFIIDLTSEFVSLLLALLSSSCVQYVLLVGASTRVSWQSQQYFEENIIVRHPPKTMEKTFEETKFFAWPHKEACENWRVFFANV